MVQKIFVTKYALTQGIIECEMEVTLNDKYFKKKCFGKLTPTSYSTGFYNNEFHLTMGEAIVDANKRRLNRIVALKKQIDKLNILKF